MLAPAAIISTNWDKIRFNSAAASCSGLEMWTGSLISAKRSATMPPLRHCWKRFPSVRCCASHTAVQTAHKRGKKLLIKYERTEISLNQRLVAYCFVRALRQRSASRKPGLPAQIRGRNFLDKLVSAAIERTNHSVKYVSAYIHLDYPGGDVPADTGVCSDEIIRAYRAVGVDLQKEVHEDMVKNWADYPPKSKWHQAHPDPSIDHRRVPNLMVFFNRKGESLPLRSVRKIIRQATSSHGI